MTKAEAKLTVVPQEPVHALHNVKYVDPDFPDELEKHYWGFLEGTDCYLGNSARGYAGYWGLSVVEMQKVTTRLEREGLIWLEYPGLGLDWAITAKGKEVLRTGKPIASVRTSRWTSDEWFMLARVLMILVAILLFVRSLFS